MRSKKTIKLNASGIMVQSTPAPSDHERSLPGPLPLVSGVEDTFRTVLCDIKDVEFQFDETLDRYTTFNVGGPVACLARPESQDALMKLLGRIRHESLPSFVLGGGSNVLAPDFSLQAVAIQLRRCCSTIAIGPNCEAGGVEMYVGAGVRIAEWLRFCLQNGLAGVEFLLGIPGTAGGAIVMNAGTRGGCIADALLWIDIVDLDGMKQRLFRSDLKPEYRSMGLHEQYIVLGGCFRLYPAKGEILRRTMLESMKQRKITQPLGYPSAGCIFRNPPGHSAGALIEQSGLKGFRIGDAAISEKHANWIVNTGNARAEDIVALIHQVERQIARNFGIRLEREIKLLFHEREASSQYENIA